MIAQGLLPYKYETEKQEAGMTALAGLPLYLDLAWVSGLLESIRRHLKRREGQQGWTDAQMGKTGSDRDYCWKKLGRTEIIVVKKRVGSNRRV